MRPQNLPSQATKINLGTPHSPPPTLLGSGQAQIQTQSPHSSKPGTAPPLPREVRGGGREGLAAPVAPADPDSGSSATISRAPPPRSASTFPSQGPTRGRTWLHTPLHSLLLPTLAKSPHLGHGDRFTPAPFKACSWDERTSQVTKSTQLCSLEPWPLLTLSQGALPCPPPPHPARSAAP